MPNSVKLNASSTVNTVSSFSTIYPELPHLKFDKTAATSREVGVFRTSEVFEI
jgi:hypothetical protein